MKNIIVLSDTHNRLPCSKGFWDLLDRADYVFHLGDGARDIELLKDALGDRFHFVYGNWDCRSSNEETIVEIEGVKFLLTHGHKYKVKSSDIDLQMRGLELGVDCCLYGHTHRAQIDRYDKLTLINPGSIAYSQSYCYMTVKDGKILAKLCSTLLLEG